jgi:hypothetical protein
MGKLRPIGSEKLEGMEKINRIIEISRYKENTPNSVNENKSIEYNITLSDGNNYQIEKEKNGYVIKKTISESKNVYDYLEPMKNRKYYSSYSQAFKRLNLIAKEVNINEGYGENISLFYESETDEAKKYFLKVKSNEQSEPIPGVDTSIEEQSSPESLPAPTPSPAPEASAPAPEVAPEEVSLPEPEMEVDSEEPNDEDVTIKTIQKLTGKLAQKLRSFSSENEEEISSNDMKYVINSILSALDLNSLDDEDKEEIMGKFEGEESEEDMDVESPEKPEYEEETEIEPEVEGEMGEDFDSEEDAKDFIKDIFSEEDDLESEDEYPRHRKPLVKFRKHNLDNTHAEKVEDMFEGLFNESKVDSILQRYFKLEEKERQIVETKRRETKSTNENTKDLVNRIKTLSENVAQEVTSRKFISKHPNAKLLGKTKKKVLVFEVNDRKFRVSPKGGIL